MALGTDEVAAIQRFCMSISDADHIDLQFLRDLEKALKWVGALRKKAAADAAFASNFVDLIKSDAIAVDIDPDNEMSKRLERACHNIANHWIVQCRKWHAEAKANEHTADLASELEETTDRLYDVWHAFDQMHKAIQKHDHDLNTKVGTFNSPEEMLAALNRS